MAKLNVKIGALQLKNPVMTASGTFGYGLEFADFMPLDGIGGIIVKGTTSAAPHLRIMPSAQPVSMRWSRFLPSN